MPSWVVLVVVQGPGFFFKLSGLFKQQTGWSGVLVIHWLVAGWFTKGWWLLMAAANKVIPSVQTVGMRALEIKHQDFFAGDGNYPDMFSTDLSNRGCLECYCLSHGGPMEGPLNTLESIFMLRETRQRTRPDLNSPKAWRQSDTSYLQMFNNDISVLPKSFIKHRICLRGEKGDYYTISF